MKTRTGILAAPLLALAATGASAMNLGELRVASHLGQPFTGYVDVLVSVAESEQQIRAAVLRDLFASSTAVDVSAFQAQVVRDGGRVYVRIASPDPIDATSFSLRLQVAHDGAALTSRYGVTLTPLVQTVATPKPARRAVRTSTPSSARSPRVAAPQAGDYGPVKSGESLWSIAKRHGASNPQAFMDEVFAANPAAFVGGDRNRLKMGAILHLPAGVTTSRAAAPEPAAPTPAESATVPTTNAEAQPSEPGDVASPVDPEFTAMISAFDAKLAAIRAKYGEEHAAETVPHGQAAAPGPLPAAPAVPAVGHESKAAAPAPLPRKPQPLAKPAEPAGAWWDSLPIAELALGALILGVLAGVLRVARRALSAKQSERAQQAHSSQEEDRKADVARKAENRVKLESEVRQMLSKKTQPAAKAPATPSQETGAPPAEGPDTPQIAVQDRLLAIDANIAHGRYVDAERLLHQVIGETPRNFSAKLRLAEVYYITEQVNGFVEIARDLLEQHRADISNEDWQRIMRMGKIIAPDAAPFSGVRAIQSAVKPN